MVGSLEIASASSIVKGLRILSSRVRLPVRKADVEFVEKNRARAERFDFFFDRHIDAADDRRNQHHGNNADHHAENRQKRAQLIASQRVNRHFQVFVNART